MTFPDCLIRICKWFGRDASTPNATDGGAVHANTQPLERSVNYPFKFLSDSPLGEDRFGRAPFARALAAALVLPADTYKDLLGRWMRRVEALFSSGIDLRREPIIYAVLYRLGQLGGDYVLARAIAKKLLESGDLRRFMRSTQLAGEFGVTYGHLDIVWDGEQLLEIIERDSNNIKRYQKAINLLRDEATRDYFKRRSTKPTTK